MLSVIATIPEITTCIWEGEVVLGDGYVEVAGKKIDINRGGGALLASAAKTADALQSPKIHAFVAGDIGLGVGSRLLYQHLLDIIPQNQFTTYAFHYLLPDTDWLGKLMLAFETISPKPKLIADAGFMYAAKMSGHANEFDLFTPDLGELAFLADEAAPHPFYTRGFILHQESNIQTLLKRAAEHQNTARAMLIKGAVDTIVVNDKIVNRISEPNVPVLEAIGGTGDTITGMLAALTEDHYSPERACTMAASINRVAGYRAHLTPADTISRLVDEIPAALKEVEKL